MQDDVTAYTTRMERQAPLTEEQKKLVEDNLGLVGLHLKNRVPTPRMPARHREYEDLFQEGCVALAKAARRFDPARHGSFPAFALARIRGRVHQVLHEYFTTIRVPTRVIKENRQAVQGPSQISAPPVTVELSEDVIRGLIAPSAGANGRERIRHVLRRRLERAVHGALHTLNQRAWRQRNPVPIMTRIAHERLLIAEGTCQTALRQIAREEHVSSGRASAYENHLLGEVRAHLTADPQVPLLMRFVREDEAGFDGVVDEARQQELAAAQLESFAARFQDMDRNAQAKVVYALIERSTGAVPEVVRNLYRWNLSAEGECVLDVA